MRQTKVDKKCISQKETCKSVRKIAYFIPTLSRDFKEFWKDCKVFQRIKKYSRNFTRFLKLFRDFIRSQDFKGLQGVSEMKNTASADFKEF